MPQPLDPLYEGYVCNRGWGTSEVPVWHDYYDDLFPFLKGRRDLVVLEIGFGQGAFLDWCATNHVKAVGVEIIPELAECAKSRGHHAICGRIESLDFDEGSFDFAFAFDVFEHIKFDELEIFLRRCCRLLRPNGCIVARFPNGASPFFGMYQFSDFTHMACLSIASISQIAERAGLYLRNTIPDRPRLRGIVNRLRRKLAYALRSLIELTIGFAYFGGPKNLDPNVIVVLARR